MSPRIKRASVYKEAKNQLIVSLNDLKRDAKAYDNGDFYAVNRASVTLRLLFYNSKYSHSLLQQLGLEKNLYLNSYAPIKKGKNILSYGDLYLARFLHFNPLANCYEYQTMHIFNPFNHKPHKIPFSEWWDEPLIFFDSDVLTRKDLIIASANEDGGAHFDESFKSTHKAYFNFKTGRTGYMIGDISSPKLRKFLLGGVYVSPDNSKYIVIEGTTLALLRQVIHEVIPSFTAWQQLNIQYKPDFDYNWKRKLNDEGWYLELKDK